MNITGTYSELVQMLALWIISNAINLPSKYSSIPDVFRTTYSQKNYPTWKKGTIPGPNGTDHTGNKPYVQITYKSGALPEISSSDASQTAIESLIKQCLSENSFDYSKSITLNGLKQFFVVIMSFCNANISFRNSFLYDGDALICYEASSDWSSVKSNISTFGDDDIIRAIATKTVFTYMINKILANARFIAIQYNFYAGRES